MPQSTKLVIPETFYFGCNKRVDKTITLSQFCRVNKALNTSIKLFLCFLMKLTFVTSKVYKSLKMEKRKLLIIFFLKIVHLKFFIIWHISRFWNDKKIKLCTWPQSNQLFTIYFDRRKFLKENKQKRLCSNSWYISI